MLKEALYYEIIEDKVHCKLCPHNCRILEGHVGACAVRKAMKDVNGVLKLYTLSSNITSLSQEKRPAPTNA